jgi:hypothetical protein
MGPFVPSVVSNLPHVLLAFLAVLHHGYRESVNHVERPRRPFEGKNVRIHRLARISHPAGGGFPLEPCFGKLS